MTKNHFLKLVKFNLWANKRMGDFILKHMNDEMADREIVSSFSSVRKTIYHIWGAEGIWLSRLNRVSPNDFESNHFKGLIQEGLQRYIAESEKFARFVAGTDEDFIASNISFNLLNGDSYTQAVADIIPHLVNHSSFHRGQLITMFRQLGFTELLPRTDFIAYCREEAKE